MRVRRKRTRISNSGGSSGEYVLVEADLKPQGKTVCRYVRARIHDPGKSTRPRFIFFLPDSVAENPHKFAEHAPGTNLGGHAEPGRETGTESPHSCYSASSGVEKKKRRPRSLSATLASKGS